MGDEAFADRAETRLNGLVNDSEILVNASHSRDLIEKAAKESCVLNTD